MRVTMAGYIENHAEGIKTIAGEVQGPNIGELLGLY